MISSFLHLIADTWDTVVGSIADNGWKTVGFACGIGLVILALPAIYNSFVEPSKTQLLIEFNKTRERLLDLADYVPSGAQSYGLFIGHLEDITDLVTIENIHVFREITPLIKEVILDIHQAVENGWYTRHPEVKDYNITYINRCLLNMDTKLYDLQIKWQIERLPYTSSDQTTSTMTVEEYWRQKKLEMAARNSTRSSERRNQ